MSVPLTVTSNCNICNVHCVSNQVFDLQVGGHNLVLPIVSRRNAKLKSYQSRIFVDDDSLIRRAQGNNHHGGHCK
ncbi:uncharacterized protein BJ212DRAFT_1313054 [Suillus subaureus]|uniref:Uncharacterized protein n=1 Tax=Suillus subaureus TaxID=48587 RepID=A0A9P7EQY4_9AGAM|nr:uncharacterized protein BJ212DRAFT_1313054 [Suillus subaureus]KAG1827558.1 hypothetical protein BJ212DRAFT_1313054 [Suillus subaureus]